MAARVITVIVLKLNSVSFFSFPNQTLVMVYSIPGHQ